MKHTRLLEILSNGLLCFPKIKFDRATFKHTTRRFVFQTLSGSNGQAVQETSPLAREVQATSISDTLQESNRGSPCEMRYDNGMRANKVNGRPRSLSEQLSSYWITPPDAVQSTQPYSSQSMTPDLLNFYTKSQVPKTKTTAITDERDKENGGGEKNKDTTGDEVIITYWLWKNQLSQ